MVEVTVGNTCVIACDAHNQQHKHLSHGMQGSYSTKHCDIVVVTHTCEQVMYDHDYKMHP